MKNINTFFSKQLFILAVFCFQITATFAQTREIAGRVIDQISMEGISGVLIVTEDQSSQTITNEEGYFVLNVQMDGEILHFSHINYQSQQQKANDTMSVKMALANIELDEILVFKKPLHEVFGTAFQNALKISEKGDLYKTYVRQFNVVNEDKINVADGLVHFYVNKPSKTPLTDLIENRAFMNAGERDEENSETETILMTLGDDFRDILKVGRAIAVITDALQNTDMYECTVRRKVDNDNTKIIVEFGPKEGLKKWKYFQGYIVFNDEQTKVLEYKYQLADKYKDNTKVINLLIVKAQAHDIGGYAVFTDNIEGYHLFYKTSYIDMSIFRKKKGNFRLKSQVEVVVDELVKNVEAPKQKQYKGNLFTQKSNYQTKFWKNRNIRPLSSKEEQILKQLEEKK
ncbi:carboxypeptidase-like regulatory domain-containing protein [Myroides indicus]|uniref:Carboxypeptidase-like protein n=1 Tax=Myroides indicus TaxID=1323422 RepID=A0A4R7EYW8_9FLAO|nr:carboxypeptidase-like regulatory domain-containing protein [Myroides indicus]TDS54641.1 carboxypeptidase-like protein [Myroides indicus]